MRRPGLVVDVAVLLGALVLAMLPLVPVFGASALVAPVLGGLALGAVVVLVARRLVWGTAVTVAVAMTGYLLAGTALAVPELGFVRLLPTAASLRALLAGAVTSWKEVLTLDPPLGGGGGVLVAPYLLALLGSIAALRLATRRTRRAAPAAALVPLVVLLLSVLLGSGESVRPAAAGVVLVLGLGTWASLRAGTLAPRRVISFLALVAVVVGCGALTGPFVAEQNPRFVLRDELVPPYDPSTQKSPLSAFRAFVKDQGDVELLTVRGLPAGARVRLATLDAYDGVVWNVAPVDAADGSGRFRRVGDEVDATLRGTTSTVEFTVHELPVDWLPTVGYSEQIRFSSDDVSMRSLLRYNDATGAAALVGGIPPGTSYTDEVVVPVQPTEDQLEGAAVGSVALPELTGVPDAVGEYATQVAGTATSSGLIARSLAEGLSQRGWFSHGLTSQGDYPSLSGHGADRITTLLTGSLMVGDGEQYAAAMALMAREMGLPARVVLGFVPEVAPSDADTLEEVTLSGQDIQAWVEVNFAGYGWVAFDPTPDPSRTPNDETPEEESAAQPQVRQPPPPPAPPVVAPDDDTEQPRTDDNQDQDLPGTSWAQVARIAGAVGIPLVLVLGPPFVVAAIKRRRRRARRRAAAPVDRVVGGWQELCDRAVELRRPIPGSATRREIAVALAGQFAPDGRDGSRSAVAVGGPLAGLATRADAYVFGPLEPSPEQVDAYWTSVDTTVATLRTAVRRRDRILSLLRVARRRRTSDRRPGSE
ncbi:transglutaminase family protein [Actinotalea sp.]|uniref:transglutaminase-like domain-containing protein n=1 Tax=Actinotalea sp. TaxID=1872145 RepID=UPI003561EB48